MSSEIPEEAAQALGRAYAHLQNLRALTACHCPGDWSTTKRHAPDCFFQYRDDVESLFAAGFQAGRDHERQKIAAEIEPHIKRWLQRPAHPPVIGDVAWQLRQIMGGRSDGE